MSDFLSKLGGVAMDRLHGSPLSRIVNHLMGGQPGASGLQALIDKLRDGGLGEKVDSWVGSGPNRPVDPAELERAIGPQEADRLAQSAGMERGGLMGILSQLLPGMVDKLTPDGRVPARDAELPGGGQGGIGGILGALVGGGQASGNTTGGTGSTASGGGLDDLLGGLLNKLGVGGTAGAEDTAARPSGMGQGADAGTRPFGEKPEDAGPRPTVAPSTRRT